MNWILNFGFYVSIFINKLLEKGFEENRVMVVFRFTQKQLLLEFIFYIYFGEVLSVLGYFWGIFCKYIKEFYGMWGFGRMVYWNISVYYNIIDYGS